MKIIDNYIKNALVSELHVAIFYNPSENILKLYGNEENETFLLPYMPTVEFLGKYTTEPIAIIGQIFQNDNGELDFFVSGSFFPNAETEDEKMGSAGKITHYSNINEFLSSVLSNKSTYHVAYGQLVDKIRLFKTI